MASNKRDDNARIKELDSNYKALQNQLYEIRELIERQVKDETPVMDHNEFMEYAAYKKHRRETTT